MFNRVYTPGMTNLNVNGIATTTYVTHKPHNPAGPNACNMQVCVAMASVTGGDILINAGTYKHSTATFTIDATNPRKAYVIESGGGTNTVFIGYVTKGVSPDNDLDISPAFQVISTIAGTKGHVSVEGVVFKI